MNANGIEADLWDLQQHIVVGVTFYDKTEYTLDPDYGYVIPVAMRGLLVNQHLVREAYKNHDDVYAPHLTEHKHTDDIVKMYTQEGNHIYYMKKTFEDFSYIAKWIFPLLLIITLFFNLDTYEKSMKKIIPPIFAGFAFLFLGFSITSIVLEDPAGEDGQKLNSNIENEAFQRTWTYVSETSAIIYWQLDDISESANSFIEYGKTENLDQQTVITKKPRWAHWHRLKGLESGEIYYYRMVFVDPTGEYKTESEILKIKPVMKDNAIRIPGDMTGSTPYILDQTDAYYILTEDIKAEGTAIEIAA